MAIHLTFLKRFGFFTVSLPLVEAWCKNLPGRIFHHWPNGYRSSLIQPCSNLCLLSCYTHGKGENYTVLFYLFFLGNGQTSFHNQMPVYPEVIGHHPNIYWSLNTLHEVIFNYLIKPEQGSGHVSFDYKCSLCSYYC